MQSYTEQTSYPPDFRVSYTLYSEAEGGRRTPALQHIRWDFCYAAPAISVSNFIIGPEMLLPGGELLTEGFIAPHGLADMFILSPALRIFHQQHLRPGVRGYFMEGGRQVGACEVVQILGLHSNPVVAT